MNCPNTSACHSCFIIFEDMPYEDIAKKLGISLAKVKNRHPPRPCRAREDPPTLRHRARKNSRHENPLPNPIQNLERFVSAALRDLPARRAPPRSLESRRVGGTRAPPPRSRGGTRALPTGRSQWRGAFLVVSAAFAGRARLGARRLRCDAGRQPRSSADFTWVATLRDVTASLLDFGAIMFRGISPRLDFTVASPRSSRSTRCSSASAPAAYRTLFANR